MCENCRNNCDCHKEVKENLSDKTLCLFVKFIMVCEDRINDLIEELDTIDGNYLNDGWEYDFHEKIKHYQLLYKDIKEHTGLTSDIIEKQLRK